MKRVRDWTFISQTRIFLRLLLSNSLTLVDLYNLFLYVEREDNLCSCRRKIKIRYFIKHLVSNINSVGINPSPIPNVSQKEIGKCPSWNACHSDTKLKLSLRSGVLCLSAFWIEGMSLSFMPFLNYLYIVREFK